MTEPIIDPLVNAIAEAVLVKLRPHLATSANVQPVLLDVKAAAEYLGRSEIALQHLIFDKAFRVGRRVHLDRRDLDAWIEKSKY